MRAEVRQAIDLSKAEMAIDDALGGNNFKQARADQKIIHSAALSSEVGQIIESMKKGDEDKAFSLGDRFDFEGKGLDISTSLGDRAGSKAFDLERHTQSYHRQYDEAPDK
jgi:hypothetical protein